MTLTHYKTLTASRRLGLSYSRLYYALRNGHIPAPPKDESGDYVWTDADIERAREALALRQQKRETLRVI